LDDVATQARADPAGDLKMKKERAMPTGTVKWFNTTKGFGFIAPDDGGKDIFVHISAVERAGLTGLADNQKVGFEMIEGRDGRQSAGELKLL
jgi:CspA family cold shock protein